MGVEELVVESFRRKDALAGQSPQLSDFLIRYDLAHL